MPFSGSVFKFSIKNFQVLIIYLPIQPHLLVHILAKSRGAALI